MKQKVRRVFGIPKTNLVGFNKLQAQIVIIDPKPHQSTHFLYTTAGAHQMEPPSPIQALGVNPFPTRFIIRTVPRGDFARRRWEEPITTTK